MAGSNSKSLKYVIFECEGGQYHSVIFHEDISHAQVSRIHRANDREPRIRSAGFCYLKDGKWHTHGRSESLDMNGNPNDYMILNNDFFGDPDPS